ncbi:MAG: guanylate kinase, partial [Gammaproteobacteria bacterium]
IDWQGAEQARNKLVDQVSIMILPPSLAELENRLRSRGKDSEEVILKRLRSAREEMSQAPNFDYIVVNQDFQIAARELVSIITAERTRTARALQRMRVVVTSLIGN